MPLRNRLYLSDLPDIADKSALEASSGSLGWIKPLWILPRAWCVTTSLQAKGVPKHKTAAFVSLHLGRLAPFEDSGVYACRTGDWVHLWFWENQRVRVYCENHGLDFSNLQLAPESVCFPKVKDGAVLLPCLLGFEAQLWHQGLLLDSAWWPEQIDKATWQKWRPTSASAIGARAVLASWPETPPFIDQRLVTLKMGSGAILFEPWASNLLGKKWWHSLKDIRAEKLQFVAAGGLILIASYLASQWWTLQAEQRRVEATIEILSPLVEPLNAARSKAMESQHWVNKLAGLRSQDDVRELLRSLQPALQRQEAAIRDFEYLDGEVRLMLAPIGIELNIVTLTQELEALPKLSNIRLLPDSDSRLTRISAKIVRLSKPSEIKVLGQTQILKDTGKTPSVQVDRSGKREKGE